jgi:hypothetical protein
MNYTPEEMALRNEFLPNPVAQEVESLREQQEYQFYVQQGLDTRLREVDERPNGNRLYVSPSLRPSPEHKAAICDLTNTVSTNKKDDSFSLSEISALILFTLIIGISVVGLTYVILSHMFQKV